MRIVKTIIVATALMAGGSAAFAQGRSTEADQAQGIRQSALAFTDQMQDRGFFGVRGVFLPVISGGFLGDTSPGARAADDRITTQSLNNRPLPSTRRARSTTASGSTTRPIANRSPIDPTA